VAAILVTVIQKWVGTAAERVALTTTNITAGSTFEESNTGLKYKWSGSAWFVTSGETTTLTASTALIGKVGIDQTTDGTTNKVQSRNTTHANFQTNSTMQVNDTDVSNTNPVPIIERKSAVVPAASPATVNTTSGGTVIAAANTNRLSITLQNNGTEPCIVRLGGDPSIIAYNLVLPADALARKGEGGSWTSNKYTGAIKGLTEANSTAISVIEEVIA